MTPDNATPDVEGYEPPELWDIGSLTELTEFKTKRIADFNGLEPDDQGTTFS
jgi:hypothetical protein